MRHKRVMLIKPAYLQSHYISAHLQAGLAYLSHVLDKAGVANEMIDMGIGYDNEYVKNQIREFKADLIGVSMMSSRFKNSYALIKDLKETFPDIKIIVGGAHVSTLRNRVLEDCPSIDYGATLEGEETIVELCRDEVPISEIAGMMYRPTHQAE